MRPKLVSYENGIATFRGNAGTFCVPGLTREGAESAVFEISPHGRYVRVVLEFEDPARRRVRFRNGRPTLRAVAIDEV